MGATAIQICSNARMLCGHSSLSAFTEDETGLTGSLWDTVRRSTLRLGTWSTCRKRALLAPLAVGPAWGWTYAFQLPSDFLRVVSIGEGDESLLYEVENGQILADDDSIKLRYVYDNDNVASYDAILVEALTFHMAQALAYPLTGSATLQEAMSNNFAATLRAARGVNGDEAPVDRLGDTPLLSSRRGSAGFG